VFSDKKPADDDPGDAYVIGQGSGDSPGRRPSGSAIVLAAAALIAGLAVGYAAGTGTSGGLAPPAAQASTTPTARAIPAARVTSPPEQRIVDGAAVEQSTVSCAEQSGSQLQLGVEVTNQSAAAVTLTGVELLFPGDAGALRELSWQWAPCGAINYELYPRTIQLLAGSSAWLSATFTVLVHCPAAYPVQFSVNYVTVGVTAATILPGFPDLGDVPDMSCPSPSPADPAYSSNPRITAKQAPARLPRYMTRTPRMFLPSCMSWYPWLMSSSG
jgi:hypothetical protein